MHSVSSISTPILNDVNIGVTFQRNKDEVIIDNLGENKNANFRIYISYFELQVIYKYIKDRCIKYLLFGRSQG